MGGGLIDIGGAAMFPRASSEVSEIHTTKMFWLRVQAKARRYMMSENGLSTSALTVLETKSPSP
jgi:hypothetical protein